MKQLVSLAEILTVDTRDFLSALLHHHRQCMAERGRDPEVFAEAQVIVGGSGERDKRAAMTRLEAAFPWDNGYYIWNAGTIYRQLFGGCNG